MTGLWFLMLAGAVFIVYACIHINREAETVRADVEDAAVDEYLAPLRLVSA